MQTVRLGRTGLEVSVAGLGCGGHSRLMRDRPRGIPTMIRVKFSALAFAAMALVAASALAALAQDEAEQPKPPRQDWTFSGMFGRRPSALARAPS